ncbi:hypothetical protein MMC30_003988 [Trapelia coarctata]|nr:hypothetical protein [Trapelia coarctata]
MATSLDDTLIQRLANELSLGLRFTIHYVSSPATSCEALFHPPPEKTPEETSCESHFLSASIDVNETKVQAFALEALVYTTATLTTIFVSKADSTGYLHLLNLPRGTGSPIKTVISTFLGLLVEKRKRNGIRLVLSLFARAQDQYLFPGSIENSKKHVLDDRGLIRWWCQILETVLLAYPAAEISSKEVDKLPLDKGAFSACGYLRAPGCDVYETRAFFPPSAESRPSKIPRWLPSDPLRALGKGPNVPERCLIPRFPDDPKARFVTDLDDELPVQGSQVEDSPSKPRQPGKWRSVRSLEEFWEMMAFRQECAAGRLVGFIWGMFTPAMLVGRPHSVLEDFDEEDNEATEPENTEDGPLPTPLHSQIGGEALIPPQSPIRTSSPIRDLPLSPLLSSQPQPRDSQRHDPASPLLESSKIDSGPAVTHETALNATEKRLAVTLPQPSYTRIISLLEQLDYASLPVAADSTQEWIAAVAKEAGVDKWGIEITGIKAILPPAALANGTKDAAMSILGPSLVRRKKRNGEEPVERVNGVSAAGEVKILGAGLVRKKPKLHDPGIGS